VTITFSCFEEGEPDRLLALIFPALMVEVAFPCECHRGAGKMVPLADVIIHLNDRCAWSREDICTWIGTLDIDTTMQAKNLGD
jgi:hypothetical protein